jgi:hypothetical protein
MLQPATQTLFLGPLTIAGLEVSRLVFAPSTGPGFLRYLDLFHNPTAEVAVREILWEQPLSQWFLFEELKLETSSGDSLFRPDDDWITLALPPRDGLPYLSFVMANEERRSTRAFVSITDSIFVRRNVVLEPGETVAFLHFLARDPTAASAREKVAALSRLAGRARDGLSATRAEQIRNFGSDLGSFLRGDTNQDGIVDITDALETLRFLFAGGVEVHCLDAADTDDDGNVDLADAFGTLAFLFLGTLPPQSPGPRSCGADPTEDSLFECRYTTSACPD